MHQGRGRSSAHGGAGSVEEVEEGSGKRDDGSDVRGVGEGGGGGESRGGGGSSGGFLCRLDNLELSFSSSDNGILVESVNFKQNMKTVTSS